MSRRALPTRAIRSSEWLRIGAAARLLGVDPDTLRRWADEGRIEAFTTPGGHRRFHRRILEALTGRPRTAAPRLRALGATPERLVAAYRRAYRVDFGGRSRRPSPDPSGDGKYGPPGAGASFARRGSAVAASAVGAGSVAALAPAIETASPVGPFTTAARAAFRADGRRLVAALVAALDAAPDTPTERDERERVATECCVRMARRLAADGCGLGEAIAAFVLARRPFLAEIARLGARRPMDAAGVARLYDDAAALLDRLLLRFVAAHQAAEAELDAAGSAPAARTDPSP